MVKSFELGLGLYGSLGYYHCFGGGPPFDERERIAGAGAITRSVYLNISTFR